MATATENPNAAVVEAEDGEQDHESLTIPLLAHQRSTINSTSQVAIVGSNVCSIESLDYEIIENDFFKQDWRAGGKAQIFQYTFMKWSLCFLIGLIIGFFGFCNNLAVENLAGVKFVVTSKMMFAEKFGIAFLSFTIPNLVLTLLASVITAVVVPAATCSGISEVQAYLNGVDAPGTFLLRTLVVKITGSISEV